MTAARRMRPLFISGFMDAREHEMTGNILLLYWPAVNVSRVEFKEKMVLFMCIMKTNLIKKSGKHLHGAKVSENIDQI